MGVEMGHLPADDGRPDPLVLHHQLPHDCALPIGHGSHDHDAHTAPRYFQVQSAGDRRRSPGGDWVEAGEPSPQDPLLTPDADSTIDIRGSLLVLWLNANHVSRLHLHVDGSKTTAEVRQYLTKCNKTMPSSWSCVKQFYLGHKDVQTCLLCDCLATCSPVTAGQAFEIS